MNTEPVNQKSLERVVSQKALQIGSSFPCQICVVGFLSGVCLTSLFLAALTSLGTFEFGGISFSSISLGNSPLNSSSSGFFSEYKLTLFVLQLLFVSGTVICKIPASFNWFWIYEQGF